jgi:hypothetical protein
MDSSSQFFNCRSAALDGPTKDVILQLFSEPFKFFGRNPRPPGNDRQYGGPLNPRRVEGFGLMRQFVASSGPR